MKRVLFLCTHNSARSQMAEGLLRELGRGQFEVASAGTVATHVRPEAIAVMGELGIDLSGQSSKTLQQFLGDEWDEVITVCDSANASCPVFPGARQRRHWPIDDPAGVVGDEQERRAAFRRARDELMQHIAQELVQLPLEPIDLLLLRRAIKISQLARDHGNHPFGALLADANGQVLLEAENTVVTEQDCTGHAETNLVRLASRRFAPEVLATCTLYSSAEPCPMCAGAIHWGNLGRLVYGVSGPRFYAMLGPDPNLLRLPCREVFARTLRPIEVIGPALEDEALAAHTGFW